MVVKGYALDGLVVNVARRRSFSYPFCQQCFVRLVPAQYVAVEASQSSHDKVERATIPCGEQKGCYFTETIPRNGLPMDMQCPRCMLYYKGKNGEVKQRYCLSMDVDVEGRLLPVTVFGDTLEKIFGLPADLLDSLVTSLRRNDAPNKEALYLKCNHSHLIHAALESCLVGHIFRFHFSKRPDIFRGQALGRRQAFQACPLMFCPCLPMQTVAEHLKKGGILDPTSGVPPDEVLRFPFYSTAEDSKDNGDIPSLLGKENTPKSITHTNPLRPMLPNDAPFDDQTSHCEQLLSCLEIRDDTSYISDEDPSDMHSRGKLAIQHTDGFAVKQPITPALASAAFRNCSTPPRKNGDSEPSLTRHSTRRSTVNIPSDPYSHLPKPPGSDHRNGSDTVPQRPEQPFTNVIINEPSDSDGEFDDTCITGAEIDQLFSQLDFANTTNCGSACSDVPTFTDNTQPIKNSSTNAPISHKNDSGHEEVGIIASLRVDEWSEDDQDFDDVGADEEIIRILADLAV